MATTYEKAPKAIEALVHNALTTYHAELYEQGVSVDVTIARRLKGKWDDEVHALYRSGYPVAAKIGITSLQDRSRGIADVKLVLDALEWDRMSDRRKAALIDHELEHLGLVPIKPTKKNGHQTGWKRDDLRRPKLRNKPHDWELAGFQAVVERHREFSPEAVEFANFRTQYAQLNLFGGADVLAIADGTKNGKKNRPRRKK